MIMVIMSSSTDRLNCWQRQEVSCSATASSNTCSIQDEVMILLTMITMVTMITILTMLTMITMMAMAIVLVALA